MDVLTLEHSRTVLGQLSEPKIVWKYFLFWCVFVRLFPYSVPIGRFVAFRSSLKTLFLAQY